MMPADGRWTTRESAIPNPSQRFVAAAGEELEAKQSVEMAGKVCSIYTLTAGKYSLPFLILEQVDFFGSSWLFLENSKKIK